MALTRLLSEEFRPQCAQSDADLDARLFAHIHLDHRLQGSHLQGHSFFHTSSYLSKLFHYLLTTPDTIPPEYKDTIQKTFENTQLNFDILIGLEKKIRALRQSEFTSVEEAENKISGLATEAITLLEQKQEILIPGGYITAQGGGHQTCYQLKKNPDGSVTVLTFNTGEGIHHHEQTSDTKNKFSPILAYTIPAKEVTAKNLNQLIKNFISPQVKPFHRNKNLAEFHPDHWYKPPDDKPEFHAEYWLEKKEEKRSNYYSAEENAANAKRNAETEQREIAQKKAEAARKAWEKDCEYGIERVYQELLSKLKQMESIVVDPKKFSKMKTQGQLAGTCTMRVLMPLLHSIMKGAAFQQFLIQLRLQSILDLYHIERKKNQLHLPLVQRQLRTAIKKHARYIRKISPPRTKKGKFIITEEFAKEMLTSLDNIKTELNKTKKQTQEVTEEKKHEHIPQTTYNIIIGKHQINYKTLDLLNLKGNNINIAGKTQKIHEQKEDSPVVNLNKNYEVFKHNLTLNNAPESISEIEKFFKTLPLDYNAAKAYWGKFNKQEAREAISQLQNILRMYGKDFNVAHGYPGGKTSIVSLIGLFSIYFLTQQYYENQPNASCLQSLLPKPPMLPEITEVSLDPVFDTKLKELETLRLAIEEKEPIKYPGSSLTDQFDIYFLTEYLSKEQSSFYHSPRDYEDEVDRTRISFYRLNTDERNYERMRPIVEAYEIYLQFNDIYQESRLFHQGRMVWFEKNQLLKSIEPLRQKQLTVKPPYSESEKPRAIGEYKTKHAFEYTISPYKYHTDYKDNKNIKSYLNISDEAVAECLYPDYGTSNQRMVQAYQTKSLPKKTIEKKSLAFTRHLHDPVRIFTTIDFVKSNPECVNDHDYQVFILMNLFTPNLLKQAIHQNAAVISNLTHLLNQLYSYHAKPGSITNGAQFCFDLTYYLTKYFKTVPESKELNQAKDQLQQFQGKLLASILLYKNNPETKAIKDPETLQKYFHLTATYSLIKSIDDNPLSEIDLEIILTQFMLKPLLSGRQAEERILHNELLRANPSLLPNIQKSLESMDEKDRETLINKIIHSVLSPDILPDKSGRLTINFPTIKIETEKNKIFIDFSRGYINSEETTIRLIPNSIYQNKNFIDLFGNTPRFATTTSQTHITSCEFFHEGRAYKIIQEHNANNRVRIFSKPPSENNWFELADTYHQANPKIQAGLVLPAKFYEPHANTWIEIVTQANEITKPTLYFSDLSGEWRAKLSHELIPNNEPNYYQKTLQLKFSLLNSKQKIELLPKEINAVLFYPFLKFEFEFHIEAWKISDGDKSETVIKLPRYNMEWIVDKDSKGNTIYINKNNPDLILITDPDHPIDRFDHGLLVKNIKTSELFYWTPKQEFIQLGQSDIEYRKLKLDIHEEAKENLLPNTFSAPTHSKQFVTFKLKDQELTANSVVDYLQLAYFYLGSYNPELAYNALQQCYKLGGIQGTLEELYLLRQIIKELPLGIPPDPVETIHDPETEAVRLSAAGLLLQHKQRTLNQWNIPAIQTERGNQDMQWEERKYRLTQKFYQEDFKYTIKNIYDAYYARLGNIPEEMQIPLETIELILTSIYPRPPYPITIKNRLEEIYQYKTKASVKFERKREKASELEFKMVQATPKPVEPSLAKRFKLEALHNIKQTVPKPHESKSPPEHKDPFIADEFRAFDRDLRYGTALNAENARIKLAFQKILNNPETLIKIENSLEINSLQNTLDVLKIKLLHFANRKITGDLQQTVTRAALAGGEKNPVEFPQLLLYFLHQDFETAQQKTGMTEAEVRDLFQGMQDYLIKATELQHQERILKLLVKLKKADKQSDIYQNQLSQLGEALISERSYDPSEEPILLVFEFAENKRLRDDQSSLIHRLLEKKDNQYINRIEQFLMGLGKSSVAAPILELAKADGKNLSIFIVPPTLFETNRINMNNTMQKTFGMAGFAFEFSRDLDCSLDNLIALEHNLIETSKTGSYVITTATRAQALELKYLEFLLKNERTPEDIAITEKLESILKLFKYRGEALVDEFDVSFTPIGDLNFIITKPVPISTYIIDTVLSLYRLFKKIELENGATFHDFLTNETVLPNKNSFENALEKLLKLIAEDTNSPLFFLSSTLTAEQKNELKAYLSNQIKHIPQFVLALSTEQKSIVGLIKGEIALLKTTLKRKANENYGLPKSQHFEGNYNIAIPYLGNNTPNERAQFGSVYETLNYTIQIHKQNKTLKLEWVKNYISDAYAAAHGEHLYTMQASLNDTAIGKQFYQDTGLNLSDLDFESTEKLKSYQALFCKNDLVFDAILKKEVLSKIEIHPSILRSNAINHAEQYRSKQGFTGTAWTARCAHDAFVYNAEDNLGLDGKTADLLLNKKPIPDIYKTRGDALTLIKETIIKHPKTYEIHAFIDTGALFQGISNLDVAINISRELLQRPENKVKHVLYFNEKNILCGLDIKTMVSTSIGSTSPEDIFEKIGANPNDYFVYYDQSHTTGVDIKLPDTAIGLASVDVQTKARDIWQGTMRMRGLAQHQHVDFVLSPTLSQFKDKWTVSDIIEHVQTNQIHLLAEYHLRSAFDKMENVIRHSALKKILSANEINSKFNLMKHFKNAFIIDMHQDPFDEFGQPELDTDTALILQQYKNRILKKWNDMCSSAEITLTEMEITKITTELDAIYQKSLQICKSSYQHLPEKEDRSVEVLKQKEKEQEKKKEKEKEKQSLFQLDNLRRRDAEHAPWGGILPSEIKMEQTRISKQDLNALKLAKLYPLQAIQPEDTYFKFSSNVTVTSNFASTTLNLDDPLVGLMTKPVNFILVIRHPISEQLTLTLITQEETKEFSDYINKHREELKAENKEAWLMTLDNDMYNGTSDAIHHPDYFQLLTQARFFNGDIDLILKDKNFDWFLDNPTEKLRFLQMKILPFRVEQQKLFPILENAILKKQAEFRGKLMKANVTELINAIQSHEEKKLESEVKKFESSLDDLLPKSFKSQWVFYPLMNQKSLFQTAIESKNISELNILLEHNQFEPGLDIHSTLHPLSLAAASFDEAIFVKLLNNKLISPNENSETWQIFIFHLLENEKKYPDLEKILKLIKPYCHHFEPILIQSLRTLNFPPQKTAAILTATQDTNAPLKIWIDFLRMKIGYNVENNSPDWDTQLYLQTWKQHPPNALMQTYLTGNIIPTNEEGPPNLLNDIWNSEKYFIHAMQYDLYKDIRFDTESPDNWIKILKEALRFDKNRKAAVVLIGNLPPEIQEVLYKDQGVMDAYQYFVENLPYPSSSIPPHSIALLNMIIILYAPIDDLMFWDRILKFDNHFSQDVIRNKCIPALIRLSSTHSGNHILLNLVYTICKSNHFSLLTPLDIASLDLKQNVRIADQLMEQSIKDKRWDLVYALLEKNIVTKNSIPYANLTELIQRAVQENKLYILVGLATTEPENVFRSLRLDHPFKLFEHVLIHSKLQLKHFRNEDDKNAVIIQSCGSLAALSHIINQTENDNAIVQELIKRHTHDSDTLIACLALVIAKKPSVFHSSPYNMIALLSKAGLDTKTMQFFLNNIKDPLKLLSEHNRHLVHIPPNVKIQLLSFAKDPLADQFQENWQAHSLLALQKDSLDTFKALYYFTEFDVIKLIEDCCQYKSENILAYIIENTLALFRLTNYQLEFGKDSLFDLLLKTSLGKPIEVFLNQHGSLSPSEIKQVIQSKNVIAIDLAIQKGNNLFGHYLKNLTNLTSELVSNNDIPNLLLMLKHRICSVQTFLSILQKNLLPAIEVFKNNYYLHFIDNDSFRRLGDEELLHAASYLIKNNHIDLLALFLKTRSPHPQILKIAIENNHAAAIDLLIKFPSDKTCVYAAIRQNLHALADKLLPAHSAADLIENALKEDDADKMLKYLLPKLFNSVDLNDLFGKSLLELVLTIPDKEKRLTLLPIVLEYKLSFLKTNAALASSNNATYHQPSSYDEIDESTPIRGYDDSDEPKPSYYTVDLDQPDQTDTAQSFNSYSSDQVYSYYGDLDNFSEPPRAKLLSDNSNNYLIIYLQQEYPDIDTVKLLINAGAPFDQPDSNQITALQVIEHYFNESDKQQGAALNPFAEIKAFVETLKKPAEEKESKIEAGKFQETQQTSSTAKEQENSPLKSAQKSGITLFGAAKASTPEQQQQASPTLTRKKSEED